MTRPLRGLVAAAAALLAASACGLPFLEKSADDYLRASLDAFSKAHTMKIAASFSVDGKRIQFDAEVVRPSSAKGTLTADGIQVEFVSSGGRTFLRGQRYATAVKPQVGRAVGSRWFVAPTADFQKGLEEIESPDTVRSGWTGLKKSGTGKVNGFDVVRLTDRTGEVDVASASPYYMVRVTTAAGQKLAGGTSDLTIDVTRYDDSSISVEAPADYIDLSDPKTLPARFQVVDSNVDHTDCGADGCRISGVLQNLDGPGTATATGTTYRSDGTTVLATCTVQVPQTAYLGAVTVGCKASSAAWQDYWLNSHEKFYYRMTVHNPGWDDTPPA